MVELIALQSLDHGGAIRRGERFSVSPMIAARLVSRGLARYAAGGPVPLPISAGEVQLSSVSPAAPVLPPTMLSTSDNGEPVKRKRGRPPKAATSS